MKNKTIIRITTVPSSLKILLRGQLKFMSNQGYDLVGISSPGRDLDEVAIAEGVRVAGVNMSRKITPLRDLKSLYQLYRIFKAERPLIVHTHTPKAGIVGMLAAWLARVPNRLHTVAGLPLLEATGVKRRVLDIVEKLTYSFATKVYPNSFGLESIIIENKYCNTEKVKVLANGSSNGIDTDFFSPDQIAIEHIRQLKETLLIKETDFVYIFVGRLVTDKGITELVEAFNKINIENPNTKLLLVGTLEPDLDPLSSETQNAIEQNPSILTAGYQNDVRPFFSIADVLVFPSYREGFPNVVMQAGAMGLPSIVSDINGCNEIIADRVNGIIIPVKSSVLLQKAMAEILHDADLRRSLQVHSRQIIVSTYSQNLVWNMILKEYQATENLKQSNDV